MAKLGRQGCQVRKVEKSLDGSGYYSSVPRWPSCNKGGVAEPQGRENRKSRVELARGRRVFTGYMAILMAVTGPSMQAYYLVKQRRFPASMIDDQ